MAAYYVNTNWWNELDQPTRDLISATTLLILIVLGTIYGGIATPTEAAALGVIASLVFALVARKLSFRLLNESAEATARNTSMLGLILFGAAYMLNFIMTQLRVPQSLAAIVSALPHAQHLRTKTSKTTPCKVAAAR